MKHLLVIALFATSAPAAIVPASKEVSVSASPVSFFASVTWGTGSAIYSELAGSVHYHISTYAESDVVKIQIERYHDIGGWKLVKELAAGAFSYDYHDGDLYPGDTYKYRARGVSMIGNTTPYSGETSITIPLP